MFYCLRCFVFNLCYVSVSVCVQPFVSAVVVHKCSINKVELRIYLTKEDVSWLSGVVCFVAHFKKNNTDVIQFSL